MRNFFFGWIFIGASLPAFAQTLVSNVYSYTQAPVTSQSGYEVRTLLEGTTRDFSHVILQAITLQANLSDQSTQQLDEEAILVIKTGELTLSFGGKRKTLRAGSVALIMPGDDYRIDNQTTQPITYYLMRYTSNEMPDLDLYRLMGSSFWIDWQEVGSNAKKENRVITYSTIMSNRVVIQEITLVSGSENYKPVTRRAAELLFILNQPVQVSIGETMKEAQVGDVIFVESDVAHKINSGSRQGSTYVSFQF